MLLLLRHLAEWVDDLDVELCGTVDDGPTLAGRHVRCDLGRVLAVVHEEHLEVIEVEDTELEEAVGHHVTGLLRATVTNVRHEAVALELTTLSRVDTLRPPPRLIDTAEEVALVAHEALLALDHLLLPDQRRFFSEFISLYDLPFLVLRSSSLVQ